MFGGLSSAPSGGGDQDIGGGGGGWRTGKGNCPQERQDATAEARGGNEAAYVPECDHDGKLLNVLQWHFVTLFVKYYLFFLHWKYVKYVALKLIQ